MIHGDGDSTVYRCIVAPPGADLEGGVRPLKFAKHMLYNVN